MRSLSKQQWKNIKQYSPSIKNQLSVNSPKSLRKGKRRREGKGEGRGGRTRNQTKYNAIQYSESKSKSKN